MTSCVIVLLASAKKGKTIYLYLPKQTFLQPFHIFPKKVDKILAGLKLEILFFLEVPSSSEKTKAISVSSGKRPSNLLL